MRCAARPAPVWWSRSPGASASRWVPVQTPLFAIFGSIALLIVADFPGNRAGRAAGLRRTGRPRRGTDHAGHPGVAHPVARGHDDVRARRRGHVRRGAERGDRGGATGHPADRSCCPRARRRDRSRATAGLVIALAVCVPAALFCFPPRHHDDLRRHAARVCAVLAHRLEGHAGAKDVDTAMNALLANYLEQRLPARRADGGQPGAGPRGRRPGLAVRPGRTTPPRPWA